MVTPILGKVKEKAYVVPGDSNPTVAKNFRGVFPDIHDKIFIPESALPMVPGGFAAQEVDGVADNNRSLIIPGMGVELSPHRYFLEIKGIGSRSSMFGFSSLDRPGGNTPHPGGTMTEHWRQRTYSKPVMTGESWFGSSPYGAAGKEASVDSVKITDMAGDGDLPTCINGFWICPVIAFNEMPSWLVDAFKGRYWYRRYRHGWFQQLRLIPSDIRLYFSSDATLGVNAQHVLKAFEIDTHEKLDGFIDNFISSGIAALTLGARTIKKVENSFSLLDYDDVWLDKDSLIAPDGTIHFADIDDIEWMPYPDESAARRKIEKQFERNYFEFMFGLDSLISQRDRMSERLPSMAGRREDLALRYEMALSADRVVKTERTGASLDMIVRPKDGCLDELSIRLVDFCADDIGGESHELR